MLIGIFVSFESINPLGNERRVPRRQPMYLIIESSTFSKEGTRRKKTNRTLFALTN